MNYLVLLMTCCLNHPILPFLIEYKTIYFNTHINKNDIVDGFIGNTIDLYSDEEYRVYPPSDDDCSMHDVSSFSLSKSMLVLNANNYEFNEKFSLVSMIKFNDEIIHSLHCNSNKSIVSQFIHME